MNEKLSKMEPYDRNIPFNQLPPLPPEAEAYLDEEVRTKLIQASRRLAELKGLASTLAEPIPVCEYDCPPGGESQ